jgi:hypothetical protein
MERKIKVALIGSREVEDYNFVEGTFFRVLSSEGLTLEQVELVSGGTRGVDTLALRLAKRYGLTITIHFPNYEKYGKLAPLVRNTKIVEDSDLVLAIPSERSRGTWDAVRKAQKRNKKVYISVYRRSEVRHKRQWSHFLYDD